VFGPVTGDFHQVDDEGTRREHLSSGSQTYEEVGDQTQTSVEPMWSSEGNLKKKGTGLWSYCPNPHS